jgi:predicted glycoside hydrolase/deacetylase ChbG (UPF0249 family)
MSRVSAKDVRIRLIINADDYGYFTSVSQGILDVAKAGLVTATGIIANGSCFDELTCKLQIIDYLDYGVHLNLTCGYPLSRKMKDQIDRYGGMLPGKATLAKAISRGRIKLDSITSEIRMQIERCINKGLKIYFLNSHEHIHMLPQIFPISLKLAKEYKIPFVRYSDAEWIGSLKLNGIIRNMIMQILHVISFRLKPQNSLKLIGMSSSGKLNLVYLKKRLKSLKPGFIYELMCHPGYFDRLEILDPYLISYHDWEAEYDLFSNRETVDLFNQFGIEIIKFRDISNSI